MLDQDTIKSVSKQNMDIFHNYITTYKLTWKDIAAASNVPVITVWSMDHGMLITLQHAQQIQKGLYKLTGIPFTGSIKVIETVSRK